MMKAELQELFNRVCKKEDWRAPIDTVIAIRTDAEMERIRRAVEFFTATTPQFEPIRPAGLKPSDGCVYRVLAVGYRNGPAGP